MGLFTIAISTFILATAWVGGDSAIMWSLMPVGGAVMASGLGYAFSPITENRKIVLGRMLGALMSGVGAPRFMTYWHPWIKEVSIDPILLIMLGAACGLVGYVIAPLVVKKLFNIAPDVVDRQVDQFAETLVKKTMDKVKSDEQSKDL